MDTDHAPIGSVAFRTDQNELLQSALLIWAESTQAPIDLAEQLVQTAMWYEAMARTWDEILSLPEPVADRVRRYT